MKFSIIMPAYNAEKTILRAIRSVQNQTYNNWELIIIDDNSSDDTVKILNKVSAKNSKITILRNKKNYGAGFTRNLGIELSKGELIAFLDSDDEFHPEKLEIFNRQITRNQNFNLFCSSYFLKKDDFIKTFSVAQSDLKKENLLKENKIGLSTVVIRRKGVNSDIVFPECRYRQDYALWLQLQKEGQQFFAIEKALSINHYCDQSLSKNKIRLLKYNFKILNKILNNNIVTLYYLIHNIKNSIIKHSTGFKNIKSL